MVLLLKRLGEYVRASLLLVVGSPHILILNAKANWCITLPPILLEAWLALIKTHPFPNVFPIEKSWNARDDFQIDIRAGRKQNANHYKVVEKNPHKCILFIFGVLELPSVAQERRAC